MGTCMCGKAKYTEEVALKLIKARKYLKGHYKCSLSDTYHVSKLKKNISPYGSRRFKFNKNRLLRELHTEMATRKAIRERIIQYMLDSYERNKTTKFSSQMVTFAVQQELGSVSKQVIAEELSRLKTKDKLIVSLNEKVPDQRGAVYFTLSEILEKETEPENVTTIPNQDQAKKDIDSFIPPTPKPIPVNPFDKVHERINSTATLITTAMEAQDKQLNEIKLAVANSEVTLEDEDHKKIAEIVLGDLNEHIHTLFGDIVNRINEVKQIASTHVTVDGDKLADVINSRLQNLKLEDSFIYRVREENQKAIEPIWDATKAVNDQTVKLSQTIQERIQNLAVPTGVSNSSDYRAGIKDGIRMALEMGLKLDE